MNDIQESCEITFCGSISIGRGPFTQLGEDIDIQTGIVIAESLEDFDESDLIVN